MARVLVNTNLRNRGRRLRLAIRKKPYWMALSEGQHLDYYRGRRVSKWVARFRHSVGSRTYKQATMAEADDYVDADGAKILSFKQAQETARRWFADISQSDYSSTTPYLVSNALDDYLDGLAGKDFENTRRRIEAIIRPQIGAYDSAKLTAKNIIDWHLALANAPARLAPHQAQLRTFAQRLIHPMPGVAAGRVLIAFSRF